MPKPIRPKADEALAAIEKFRKESLHYMLDQDMPEIDRFREHIGDCITEIQQAEEMLIQRREKRQAVTPPNPDTPPA